MMELGSVDIDLGEGALQKTMILGWNTARKTTGKFGVGIIKNSMDDVRNVKAGETFAKSLMDEAVESLTGGFMKDQPGWTYDSATDTLFLIRANGLKEIILLLLLIQEQE